MWKDDLQWCLMQTLTHARASTVQGSIYCMLKPATNINGNAGFRMNTRSGPRGYVKLEY